jgi:hypothetical protein
MMLCGAARARHVWDANPWSIAGACDDLFMLRAVLLDVNGTLTDPSAIGAAWARPDVGERVLQQAISTAMVAALLRDVELTFREHLSAAIDVVAAAADLDPHASAQVLESAGALPARPGAADALATLRDGNLRIVALTNSGAEAGRANPRGVWSSAACRTGVGRRRGINLQAPPRGLCLRAV